MKNNKYLKFVSIFFSIIFCLCLQTIAYSAISSTVKVTGAAYARVEADVRITDFNVYQASTGASSGYEEFNKESISTNVSLAYSDSYVMYKVEVTNYGDDVGIYSIDGLPSYLDYELVDYSLKSKLCDSSNKCNFGSVSNFYIKIKWKDFDSNNISHDLILNFEFRSVYSISYYDIKNNSSYPTLIMNGEDLSVSFVEDISNRINVYVDGVEVSRSTYSYDNVGGTLFYENVIGDLVVEKGESILIDGKTFSANLKNFINGTTDATYSSVDSTVTYIGIYEDRIPNGYTKDEFLALSSLDVSDDGRTKAYHDNDKVYIYSTDDIIANKDSYSLFRGYEKLTELNILELDTSRVYTAQSIFNGLTSLEYIDLSNFVTSGMGNMQAMFNNCNSLLSLDLSNFDTSNAKELTSIFASCSSLKSIDISSFVNVRINTISAMFNNCLSLEYINFGNFDTTTITDLSKVFYFCESLVSVDISNFNTSNVTTMERMFGHCTSLKNIYVGAGWDTSSVTVSERMFGDCFSLPSYDESCVDVSKAYVGFNGYLRSVDSSDLDHTLNTLGGDICLGQECFNIISVDDDNVTLLSKYNLYVGGSYNDSDGVWAAYGSEATGIQDSTMVGFKKESGDIRNGTSVFSTSNYWVEENVIYPKYVYNINSILYPYLENYKNYLVNNGASINTIRLINYDDLIALRYNETNKWEYVPDWVGTSSFWTGIAFDDTTIYAISMHPGIAEREYTYKNSYGIRPVIEMSVSEIRRIYGY